MTSSLFYILNHQLFQSLKIFPTSSPPTGASCTPIIITSIPPVHTFSQSHHCALIALALYTIHLTPVTVPSPWIRESSWWGLSAPCCQTSTLVFNTRTIRGPGDTLLLPAHTNIASSHVVRQLFMRIGFGALKFFLL